MVFNSLTKPTPKVLIFIWCNRLKTHGATGNLLWDKWSLWPHCNSLRRLDRECSQWDYCLPFPHKCGRHDTVSVPFPHPRAGQHWSPTRRHSVRSPIIVKHEQTMRNRLLSTTTWLHLQRSQLIKISQYPITHSLLFQIDLLFRFPSRFHLLVAFTLPIRIFLM